MSGESITIIHTDEGIKIEAEGFKNGACLKDLESIQKALAEKGIKVSISDQQIKPEGMINATKGTGQLIKR